MNSDFLYFTFKEKPRLEIFYFQIFLSYTHIALTLHDPNRYSINCIKKSSPASFMKQMKPELKTLEWDVLNPDRFINLEINNKRKTIII